jgi:hypothetical protein
VIRGCDFAVAPGCGDRQLVLLQGANRIVFANNTPTSGANRDNVVVIAPCPSRSSFPLHPCSFFSPPCGRRGQTHMRSSSVSVRSLFGHVSIVIPPLFFYLSRIGNSFPKRVLIRKKPAAVRAAIAAAAAAPAGTSLIVIVAAAAAAAAAAELPLGAVVNYHWG